MPQGTFLRPPSLIPSLIPMGRSTGAASALQTFPLNNARSESIFQLIFKVGDTKLSPNSSLFFFPAQHCLTAPPELFLMGNLHETEFCDIPLPFITGWIQLG